MDFSVKETQSGLKVTLIGHLALSNTPKHYVIGLLHKIAMVVVKVLTVLLLS